MKIGQAVANIIAVTIDNTDSKIVYIKIVAPQMNENDTVDTPLNVEISYNSKTVASNDAS